jgi:autotransporter-associated beta strand protein
LGGTNTYTAATTVQQGNLVAGSNSLSGQDGAFGNATSEINLGVAGANNNAGILIGGAFNVGRNVRLLTSNTTDAGTRVLTIGGNTAHNSEFSGNIILGTDSQAGRGITLTAASGGQVTFSGVIQNPTSMDATTYTVTKAGLGTVVLSNANTYTGATAVTAGTLVLTGATHSTNAITFTGGSLGLDTGFPVTAASAAVDLTNGTITVTGTTGNPSYTLLTAASITGTPVLAAPVSGYTLQVIDGATDELRLVQTGGGSPYDTWSGGAPFDDDANGDGVPNGLAWLLGATGKDVSALDKLPTVTQSGGNLVMSFTCLATADRGTATLNLEYDGDLAGTWLSVPVPGAEGDPNPIVENTTTGSVSFVATDGGTNGNGDALIDVVATISDATESASGKLFGRLKGVKP